MLYQLVLMVTVIRQILLKVYLVHHVDLIKFHHYSCMSCGELHTLIVVNLTSFITHPPIHI